MKRTQPIIWKNNSLHLIDQRKLPLVESYIEINTLKDTHAAIRDMVVRGAPCIGFSAIFGLALIFKSEYPSLNMFNKECDFLITSRPTAVNLRYEVNKYREKIINLINNNKSQNEIFNQVATWGMEELEMSEERNRRMASFAQEELCRLSKGPFTLMTHCNTGTLACGSLGTALGVISYLNENNLAKHVYVDETRPYNQGARLTAYELSREEISHEIVVEGAASFIMENNTVDAIFVGADRIAANGDTANKIGTATLAIVAKHYNVPFYVVAPLSSFDTDTQNGSQIEIEMRPQDEILYSQGNRVAPEESQAYNPSFDITDNSLITGIVCEKGVLKPPFTNEIKRVFNEA